MKLSGTNVARQGLERRQKSFIASLASVCVLDISSFFCCRQLLLVGIT